MSNAERFADWANDVAGDPRRRKRWALALIAFGLAVGGAFHNRIYNTFWGPFPIETSAVVRLTDVPFGRYVRLEQGGKPLGYAEIDRTHASEVEYHAGGSETVASYKVLAVDGRRMLVRFAGGAPADSIEGVLTEVGSMQRDVSVWDSRVPLYLDCSTSGFKGWTLAIVALALVAVGVGLDQLRRARKKPETRPLRRFT